jgi:hypothetical protein
MAVTHSVIRSLGMARGEDDRVRLRTSVLTPDTSWLAAGEVVDPDDLGFTEILGVVCLANGGGIVWTWDPTNIKILAYWVDTSTDGAPLAACPNATNLSTITPTLLWIGY